MSKNSIIVIAYPDRGAGIFFFFFFFVQVIIRMQGLGVGREVGRCGECGGWT